MPFGFNLPHISDADRMLSSVKGRLPNAAEASKKAAEGVGKGKSMIESQEQTAKGMTEGLQNRAEAQLQQAQERVSKGITQGSNSVDALKNKVGGAVGNLQAKEEQLSKRFGLGNPGEALKKQEGKLRGMVENNAEAQAKKAAGKIMGKIPGAHQGQQMLGQALHGLKGLF